MSVPSQPSPSPCNKPFPSIGATKQHKTTRPVGKQIDIHQAALTSLDENSGTHVSHSKPKTKLTPPMLPWRVWEGHHSSAPSANMLEIKRNTTGTLITRILLAGKKKKRKSREIQKKSQRKTATAEMRSHCVSHEPGVPKSRSPARLPSLAFLVAVYGTVHQPLPGHAERPIDQNMYWTGGWRLYEEA